MSFWGALGKVFNRSAEAAVAGPVKAVTGAVKDVSGAAKDVAVIRKDLDPKAKRIIREAEERTTFVFWERAMAVTVLYALATVFSDEVHAIFQHIRALLGK